MDMSTAEIWIVIAGLGVGTYLIRFSFLGLIGNRDLPDWIVRMLRFTPVAVLPAVIAPMIATSGDGESDPFRYLAALTTVVVALVSKNMLLSIGSGLGLFFGLHALLG